MSKTTNHPQKKGGFPLFRLALGAALAAGAGYYVTHKEKVDKEAKKRIDLLAKLFKEKRPAVEKRVKEIWGKVSAEGIATYMELRGQLLHALEKENLEKHGKMLKANYENLVEEIIGKAKKSGMLTPEVEAKLTSVLKMDWKEISGVLMDLLEIGARKTVAAVKKVKSGSKSAVKKSVKNAAKKKTSAKPVKKTSAKSISKSAGKSVKSKSAKKAGVKKTVAGKSAKK